jgi:hypothetical protein
MRENKKHCYSPVDEWSAEFFFALERLYCIYVLIRVYPRTNGTTKLTVQCFKKLVGCV